MWRSIGGAFVLACIGLLSAGSASAATRVCVDSTQTGFSLSPAYACGGENPLYEGSGAQGTNPLYENSLKGGITGTLPGGWNYAGLPLTTDDASIILSPVVNTGTGAQGFVTFSNGVTGPIRTTGSTDAGDFGLSRKSGSVIYLDRSDADTVLRTIAPDGKITGTIPSATSFGSLRSCAISSNSNEVAFVGTPQGAAAPSLYVASPSASAASITISGSNFGACAVSSASLAWTQTDPATGAVALFTAPRDVASGLPTGKRQHLPFTVTKSLSFSLSNDGQRVGFCDGSAIYLESAITDGFDVTQPLAVTSADVNLASFAPLGPTPLVSVGSPLDGSTVTSLSLAPQSFTASDGELMFFAQLADGTNGIFAVTAPEPTTLATIVAGAIGLCRRRRRAA